jgi:hypothetical protein
MENHYSNAEQDVLRQAFLPTSYVQIRRLPSRIRPGFTTHRRQRQEEVTPIRCTTPRHTRIRVDPYLVLTCRRSILCMQDLNTTQNSIAGYLKGSMNYVVSKRSIEPTSHCDTTS